MATMKTLHVVGFKNSGKTTLVSRWVRLLKQNGYSVSVIKQHGHHGKHGKLKMPDANTDSMKFFNNGADLSIVSGGGAVQMMLNESPDFQRLKQLATIDRPDVLLIEGFKEEMGPKVVLVKEAADWETLKQLQTIELVVGLSHETIPFTQISSRNNEEELDQWLLSWMGVER